ncbi:MAG: hypothetical protein OZ922_01070 [Myxococcales bacterium]|nr:hypothetical protein [Myxococcales bacterium]
MKKLRGIGFVDSDVGWAVGTEEILRSTDGGLSWSSQRGNATVPTLRLEDVAFGGDSLVVAVGAEAPPLPVSPSGPPLILRTEDMGLHWTPAAITGNTPAAQNSALRDACFTASGVGIAVGFGVTGSFVVRSANSGRDWVEITQEVVRGLPTTNPTAVACVGNSDVWIVGQGTTIVAHSSDAGISWVDRSAGISSVHELFAVSFTDPLTGWVGGTTDTGTAVILNTRDGGGVWVRQVLPETQSSAIVALQFATPLDGVAVGAQDSTTHALSLYTNDGGARWATATLGSPIFELSDVSSIP